MWFGDEEPNLMKAQIALGIPSHATQKRLLRDNEPRKQKLFGTVL